MTGTEQDASGAAIDLSHIRKKLLEQVELELEKQLRNIPQKVEAVVESALLSIIGVQRSSGGYSVDTWDKRAEALNGFIKRKTEEKIEQIIGPLVEKELNRLFKLKSLRHSISDRCHNRLIYEFEDSFKGKVNNRMSKLGEKFGEQIGDELDKALESGEFITELADPNSFQGRIGNLLLEEIAQGVAAEAVDGPD